jgi:Cdc6-like AAA superfamily ATPase
MTGFFKGRAVGQIDTVLINGKPYTANELKEIIKLNEKAS